MKVVGSFQSVVRGVSEQVPEQRHSGQHYEQVNMMSDPVHGLVRRHGSVTQDEAVAFSSIPTAQQLGYMRQYRTETFFVAGTEYSLTFQGGPRVSFDGLPFAICTNKDTGKFVPVQYVGSTPMDPWFNNGVSAMTTVGQFIILAANNYAPTYTQTNPFNSFGAVGVVQVRTGQYSHTYTIKVKKLSTGVTFTATYTTMASSYPNLLNTSDIPATAPDYQKQVNDRVYAYNSAVNKWIGDAAADIQPQNIAEKLFQSLAAQGYVNVARYGGTVIIADAVEIQVDDSGDGSGLRAVLNEVDDTSRLTSVHWYNKVVKVTTKGAEPFYMKAVAENPSDTGSWGNVRWQEAPAQVITPQSVFAIGVIQGGVLKFAGSPTALAGATGLTVPTYASSVCGSVDDEGGLPYFFNKKITALTMFQDRLMIIANGVIFASRTGDYFNWFRKSKLTVADDDPVEMFALGAEDDVIRHVVSYNKDALLFGDRKQYAIPGRTALTPKSATVSVAASERDAASARPAVQANLVFYAKSRPAAAQIGPSKFASSINQFQLGLFQDTPEAYDISQQLGLYLRGKTIEMVAVPKPHTVVMRTDGLDNGIYMYNYLDQQGSQQRAFDSWHRWEWDQTNVGTLIGVTESKGRIRVLTFRWRNGQTWQALEEFPLDSALSDRPHLDMQRSANAYATGSGFLKKGTYEPATGAVAATAAAGNLVFLGADLAHYDQFMAQAFPGNPDPPAVVGVNYTSMVDLTPPYTRDRNDVAIVNGRLIVNRYAVRVAQTGGMKAFVTNSTAAEPAKQVLTFNGRRVSLTNNVPSQQPVSDATLSVPVGRANTEHRVQLMGVTWLPLSITAIEWVGQFYNNARRV